MSIGPTETLVIVRSVSSRTSGGPPARHVSGVGHIETLTEPRPAGSEPCAAHHAGDIRFPVLCGPPTVVGIERIAVGLAERGTARTGERRWEQ